MEHEVPPHIDAMAKSIVSGTTKLMQTRRNLIDALVQVGIAEVKTLHCSRILTDPSNRNGVGLIAERCHFLIQNQAFDGWHSEEFQGLVRDVPPAEQQHVIRFNERIVADAAVGKFPLAPVRGPVDFTTLLGNHSTQAYRLVHFEVPHANADLCINGRLSVSAVRKKDGPLANVCTDGAPYTHVPSWFFKKYPGLDLALQEAGNITVQTGEHDWQLHRKVYAAMSLGLNYEQVKAQCLRSRPPNCETIPFWHAFIERFAGGVGEPLLLHTEECIRVFNPPNRLMNPKVLDALSQLWKAEKQCETLRHAIIKLWYAGDTKNITDADVKKLGNPNALLHKALSLDSMLSHMATSIDIKNVSDMQLNALVRKQHTLFEMDAVSLIMDKPTEHVKQLEAQYALTGSQVRYTDLALECVDRVEKILGYRVTDRYDPQPAAAAKAPRAETQPDTPSTSTSSGSSVPPSTLQSGDDFSDYIMKDIGFKVDMKIIHKDSLKKDKTDYRIIKSIAAGRVMLDDAAGLQYEATVASFQDKAWVKYAAKDTTKVADWSSHSPCNSTLWSDAVIKAMCVKSVYEAYHATCGQENLDLVTKPSKGAVANCDIQKGSVCLVPTTSNISIVAVSDEKAGVCIGTIGNKKIVLSAMTVQPQVGKKQAAGFYEAFWFVAEADDAKDVNCSLSDCTSKKYVFKNDGTEIKFTIPTLTNTKDLKSGEFLKLPKAKPKKDKSFADLKCPAGGKRIANEEAGDNDKKAIKKKH